MYSQNQEEEIILDYFKDYKGALLDLGANDGVTLSNSRALIESGWSGLLVEASPEAYSRLEELKTKYNGNYTVLMNCAIGSYDGHITLYESGEHLNKGDVALVSSVNKKELARWGDTVTFEERVVPCLTFKTILGLSPFEKFDFITMDIEGSELEVLPQINFEKLGTRLVCVEYNGKNEHKYTKIMKGFNLIHRNGENLIYAK